eukprot:364432-Chlamydomonas_euryale.AAC.3
MAPTNPQANYRIHVNAELHLAPRMCMDEGQALIRQVWVPANTCSASSPRGCARAYMQWLALLSESFPTTPRVVNPTQASVHTPHTMHDAHSPHKAVAHVCMWRAAARRVLV